MDHRNRLSSLLSRTDILLATLIGIGVLAIYVRTAAPSLLWGDSAEFQTLSYFLGMSHPSGYMTQIMIGKLFTYLPVGNVAYRVNLMSAFFGALTVAEIYLIGRLLGGLRVAVVGSCLLLAFAESFWWRALVAESYTPAAAMLAMVWLFILLWRNSGKWQFLFLAGLAGGLSVGIHATVVMTSVSVLVFMALTARRREDWLGAAGGALLGALLTFGFFLYLDHNDPPVSIYNTVYRVNLSAFGLTPQEFDTPLKRLFAIFPAGSFWSYYFSAESGEIIRRLQEFISYFPVWMVALIAAGILTPFLQRRLPEALYPLIAFILIWGFAVTVVFSVYREFYVPMWSIVYIWFGLGTSAMLRLADRLFNQKQVTGKATRLVIGILLVLLPVWNARDNLTGAILRGVPGFVVQHGIYPAAGYEKAFLDARDVLNRVEDDAIIFTNWDKLYSVVYTAHVELHKRDVSVHEWLTDDPEGARSAVAYIDENIDERPIYFSIVAPRLPESFRLEQVHDMLYRVYRND